MKNVHTHYDNLKVARDAPPEVIRAAYKTLSQRFHPDRNPGNHEATRVMAIINTSYEVLSDPEKRKRHDVWIEGQEKAAFEGAVDPSQRSAGQPSSSRQAQSKSASGRIVSHVLSNWALYVVAGIFVWIWAIEEPRPPAPGPKPYKASPAPERPIYVRPASAPNGNPWPNSAGYVKGYQQLHANGLSTVTVDNSRNDSDVFVKLVSLDGPQAYPVRQVYIPAYGAFTLKKVTAGSYDIRYRDLSNGGLSRSEAITVEEISTYNGTQFSNITITLYKVQNGNMQTYGLAEAEF